MGVGASLTQMAGTALHAQRPMNVPRLALPSPGTVAAGDEIGTPAFRRQINVALGRSHSQRTPRRDVIFNMKHGSMVENQRVPLAMGSSSARTTTLSGGCDHDSENIPFSSPRWGAHLCLRSEVLGWQYHALNTLFELFFARCNLSQREVGKRVPQRM